MTCSRDGSAKYLLQPAFIEGTNVTNATAGIPQNGASWLVNLEFDSAGAKKLSDASTQLYVKPTPQNQFAIVLDGVVFSSPYFKEPILGGTAQIEGNFSQKTATDLANVLKYGALPVTLNIAEVTSLSPTLGTDQLNAFAAVTAYLALGEVLGALQIIGGALILLGIVVMEYAAMREHRDDSVA